MTRKFRFAFALLAALLLAVTFAYAEEVTLVDNDSITIRITGFGKDDIWGTEMNLYLENKTDLTLMYAISDCAVNGVMNDLFWAKELEPHAKANASATWMSMTGNADTEGITKLELAMRVYDSSDWSADPIVRETFVVYPQGEGNVKLYTYTPAADKLLFDTADAAMYITGFRHDDLWGYTADVVLINKTGKKLMFSVSDALVNGFDCDPFWATELMPGTCKFSDISWSDSKLEENGITKVDEIVLKMRVYDSDDWLADDLLEDSFTVKP
ncbi:MAG: hypothetical protein Q4C54_10885 [Clostridia bacterium]|nr:hypothetical protein [Clostridia bacterium]